MHFTDPRSVAGTAAEGKWGGIPPTSYALRPRATQGLLPGLVLGNSVFGDVDAGREPKAMDYSTSAGWFSPWMTKRTMQI